MWKLMSKELNFMVSGKEKTFKATIEVDGKYF